MPWPSTVRLNLKFLPSNRFIMEYSVSKIPQKRYFLFRVRLYNKPFAVNLKITTQTVLLQRDNYNIKMGLNSSERIILSSANTVSSINLILNIPGCFLYEER